MVISAITGATSSVTITEPATVDSAVIRQIEDRKTPKEIESIMGTEQYVREYFSDIPIMIHIAECESSFRHLDKDGEIHRGVLNPADVGVMQINEFYHLDRSQSENYNIYTIEGNTSYARELYEREGTDPWNSSKACWGKYLNRDLALNNK